MSIQSKLTNLRQTLDQARNHEELNRYLKQDKIKQLLIDAQDIDEHQAVIESNDDYQVVLIGGRIELYVSELELLDTRDIRLLDRSEFYTARFVRTWSSDSTLTVSLESDEVKVESHEPIKNSKEIIDSLEYLLFGKTH